MKCTENMNNLEKRNKILSKISTLQGIPAMTINTIRLLEKPDVDVDKVINQIQYDQGMSANILRMANSAFFGGSKSIANIKDAMVFLGMDKIKKMAMTSAMGKIGKSGIKGYDLKPGSLLEGSVAVALITTILAAELGLKLPAHAFTAALMHDIGKIVLGTFVEADSGPIADLAFEKSIPFDEAERQILGIDHAEVGAYLLNSWSLPKSIVDVVRWHHHPECFFGDTIVVDVIHVADSLAMMIGIGTGLDELNYHPSSDVISRLNISTAISESVLCRFLSEFEDVRTLFNMNRN